MSIPLPTLESLAHRARLAALVSELRPARFRVFLTRLPAHRIPTLWTLYRGIMRDAPDETIRSRMRAFFRRRKTMQAQGDVTRELRKAHKWWEIFRKVKAGDPHFQAVCARYSRMIEGARLQQRVDQAYEDELAWYKRMRSRPIMTGGYLRPSLFNGPLPRLVPQPAHISGMISNRKRGRARRITRFDVFQEHLKLLHSEIKFEQALYDRAREDGVHMERLFSDDPQAWREPIKQVTDEMTEIFGRERARQRAPYPPELLAQIKEARRERIRNQTRQRQREGRGAMTKRLLKQMRKGPPPHVLALMSEEQRRMDRIARCASEVGYVAQVKRKLGFKLKDPEAWKVELGRPENQEMLDRMSAEIETENARRRESSDEMDKSLI